MKLKLSKETSTSIAMQLIIMDAIESGLSNVDMLEFIKTKQFENLVKECAEKLVETF